MRYPKQSTESHNVAENGGHCRKRILSQVSKDPAFGFIGENSDQVSDCHGSPLDYRLHCLTSFWGILRSIR